MIGDDDDFNGFRSAGLPQRYERCAKLAHARVCKLATLGGRPSSGSPDDLIAVTIFGELFGGAYPGQTSEVQAPVQIGVWYTSELEFMPFDVAVKVMVANGGAHCGDHGGDHGGGGGGEGVYLDYEVARAVCASSSGPSTSDCAADDSGAGFNFAPSLLVGTFSECMNFSHEFDSTLPAMYGMPPLPAGTNLAEGLVVKSCVEDAERGSGARMILKRKIDNFAEIVKGPKPKNKGANGGGKQGWGKGSGAGDGGVTSPAELVYYELVAGVTEPRVQAVLSKDTYHLDDPEDAKVRASPSK